MAKMCWESLKTLCYWKETSYKRTHIIWFHFYETSIICKSMDSWLSRAKGEGLGEMRSHCKGYKVSLADENVLKAIVEMAA